MKSHVFNFGTRYPSSEFGSSATECYTCGRYFGGNTAATQIVFEIAANAKTEYLRDCSELEDWTAL
jgi:hypothetical protein